MIVDCFTHTWESAEQLGRCFPADGRAGAATPAAVGPKAGISRHISASRPVTTTMVLGFKSRYLAAEIPNDHVAAYVRNHPGKLIGFAGLDPSDPKEALAEMRRAKEELGMPGLAVAPAAQDFHPTSSQAMRVYAQACEINMPIVFHTGVAVSPAAKLEYAQPVLLDEVARELPELKMVIAHMGYPWVQETIVLLAKHPNVFAEVSRLAEKPWTAYQVLLCAYQSGVMDKLLFGSGFPHALPSQCIEALYSLNHLCHGTSLPTVPRDQIRGIVERDALTLLGIPADKSAFPTPPAEAASEEADASV